MTAEITFAVPFYRGLPYLQLAIDSVLRQTNPNWLLTVVDDCGPDGSAFDLVRKYADTRIRYTRNEMNLGMAGNWNRCLDGATTDLVTLLHADDELRPGYADCVLKAATAHSTAAAIFCATDIIGPNGEPAFSLPDAVKKLLWRKREKAVLAGRHCLEALCLGNFLMCPTACYRKSILGARRFDPRWRFVLDLDFFTRLLLDGERFVLDPTRAYAYRRHKSSATESYTRSKMRFAEESTFYAELADRLQSRGLNTAARRARQRVLVRLNYIFQSIRCLSRDN